MILPLLLSLSLSLFAQSERIAPVSSAELGDSSPFSPVMFGDGIEFSAPNDKFHMNLRFRMQNRADMIDWDDDLNQPHDPTFDWRVRRLRLRMNGYVTTPKLRYLIQLSFSRSDQDFNETSFANVVRDAMVIYELNPKWQFAFGQGKLPGNRQRVISSGDQQFVDRSIVNAAFNFDRDFGFQSQYSKTISETVFRWKNAITSGEGRNQSVPPDQSLFYITRLELLPTGEFSQNGEFFEGDLVFERDFKIVFGGTSGFLEGAARANGSVGDIFTTTGSIADPVVRRSQWVHYLDTLMKWRGHSLYLEWALRKANNPIINAQQSLLTGQGYNIQFGKMLSQKTELTLRHSALRPDQEVIQYHQDVREWILGMNYFIDGHRIKLQGNIGHTEGIQNFARLQLELGI